MSKTPALAATPPNATTEIQMIANANAGFGPNCLSILFEKGCPWNRFNPTNYRINSYYTVILLHKYLQITSNDI